MRYVNQILFAIVLLFTFILTPEVGFGQFQYTPDNVNALSLPEGKSKAPTINWQGGDAGTFSMSPTIKGVSIDSSTGVISWTSDLNRGTKVITVTASSSTIGNVTTTYTILKPYIFLFDTDGDKEDWTSFTSVALSATNGMLTFRVNTGPHKSLSTRYEKGINTSEAAYAHVVFRSASDVAETLSIRAENRDLLVKNISKSSDFKTYDFELKSNSLWTGTVSRVDFFIHTTDNGGLPLNDEVYFDKIVFDNNPVLAPENLSYATAYVAVNSGAIGGSVTPTIRWNNDPGTFSISPTTTGLSIDATTGVISWDSTLTNGKYNLTITATNSSGLTTTTYTIRRGVLPPSDLTYDPDTITFEYNETASSVTPTLDWNGDQGTFILEEDTEGKITIDETTGIISWMSNLSPGTHTLTVTAKNSAGALVATFTLIVGGPDISGKGEFKLHQNYPNPTDGVTYFVYDLTQSSWVRIDVLGTNGKLIRNLMLNRYHQKGRYILKLNTQSYNSGVYFLRIYSAKEGHQAIKFMVVR